MLDIGTFLDDRTNRFKLLIFSLLVISSFSYSFFSSSDAAKLLCFAIFHASVIILPIILFSLLAYKAGIRENFLLLCAGALGSGLIAYINFWLWFANSKIGIFISVSILLVMISFILRNRFFYKKISFFTPLIFLWFFYALFILSIGMAPFGLNDVLSHVATRFSHHLPYDNQLPYILAEQIASGSISIPMTGGWLTSDRPPLQAGYFLATGAVFFKDSALHYQICSTLLQCLWILPLVLILQKRVNNQNVILSVLFVTMFSGFRNLWTPFAELYHHESLSRGKEDTTEKQIRFSSEANHMRKKWGHILVNDPFYNPHLSLIKEDFSYAEF
jgi:hypothetical protein